MAEAVPNNTENISEEQTSLQIPKSIPIKSQSIYFAFPI